MARALTCLRSTCGSKARARKSRAIRRMSAKPCPARGTCRYWKCSRWGITRCGSFSTTCTPPASTAGIIWLSSAANIRAIGRIISTRWRRKTCRAIRAEAADAPEPDGETSELDDHRGADPHPVIQIDDIRVGHTKTAGRIGLADRLFLVRTVNAIEGGTEIHRAGAERVFRSAFHV